MKNLKAIFSNLLFLLIVSQFNFTYAENAGSLPNYQNIITNISLNYEGSLLAGNIELNNGQMILRIVDYKLRDDNAMKGWAPGDVVVIEPQIKHDVLLLTLKNAKNEVEPYLVYDVINSSKEGFKIEEISKDGKFIKLNNGSVWEFGWFNRFSTQKWKAGQCVAVQKYGDKNSYGFINFDIAVNENASSASGSFVVN